jgi:tetratricopeptide (TPR) repeat protein
LLFALLLGTRVGVRADIAITFDLKDGSKISDVTRLVAHVKSNTDIDKVDFSVDDKPRASVTSVPYLYEWDTLADSEGPHTVKVTATDSKGNTKEASLGLVIDNELGSGAGALAQKARDALSAGDADTARRYTRRALKVDPADLAAARVSAELYARDGDYVKAVAQFANARGLDTDSAALSELASYRLHLALEPSNTAHMLTDIQEAVALRRKAADLAVDAARKQYMADTPAAHEAVGDALLDGGRLHDAIAEYSKSALGDSAPPTSVNRLALAYILNSQEEEALRLVKPYQIAKTDDVAMRAVIGLAYLRLHQEAQARATVAPDLPQNAPATLIVAAAADFLLNNLREARNEGRAALKLRPGGGDAQYALSITDPDPRASDAALQKALALAPFQPGPYLDYAARINATRRTDRLTLPAGLVNFVLTLDPDNVTAQVIKALIEMETGPLPDAKTILENQYKIDKNQPDVLLAISAYYNVKEDAAHTSDFLKAARAADQAHFSLQVSVSPAECITYLIRKTHYRVYFFLTPTTLYPTAIPVASAH